MAETKREIERKYEAPVADEGFGLPDLSHVAGVSAVIDKGVVDLDAVYYDTADQRLAAAAITLRRRTGGADAGWHLKLPVSLAEGVRDEIRAPLSDDVPRDLTGLVRSRVREADLVPVMRLRSSRDVRDLTGADGALLAEVSVDGVRAERLTGGAGAAAWTEIEVELADGGDPAFLGKVEKKLRKAGASRSASPSKLARALTETGIGPRPPRPADDPETSADHVLVYLRAQRDAIVDLDPAVRRDLPDSVHQMRVATRRLRSALRSYRRILDRDVTDPIGDELKWLAGELGVDRDQEVLTERLTAALDELPRELPTGPVRARLQAWSQARRRGSRRHLIDALDGKRYLALLAALDALVDAPPLRAEQPENALSKAVLRDYKRLAGRVEGALDTDPGPARDLALHNARKAAKRSRYAAEVATPALGHRAKDVGKHAKALQSLLGEHQDSVMAREALLDLAAQAHAAGESSFTYGLLYGREEALAERAEAELSPLWAKAVS
ncbi:MULTISPECIES: CYTH and CHAD domain-containing protein [unclassified Streptomyces]|uniref:CYTH and CHAD domain-containing protein n=1 Tax=unclassified Streptomyces TaxID=2593676 RepID=UPI002DDB8EBF|nr:MULTISPECIES: CYTH and CHAD domain-containing protein [unclassified Streptomyces]WSD98287.1 CYTH and CHAD domain-containing protein [Streptomyces sp. NBC_01474]